MDSSDNFSFVQAERDVLNFWESKNIFKKSLEQTKGARPYIFYDGPPFATGLPHHGHLLTSTIKDIIPRYFTMKGRYVERRFGWDCHGLPVEAEIDKMLGMDTATAVKKLGIKGYNDRCRSIVQKYTKEWRKTITRLGRWVDFDDDYKTMDLNFMESVWWAVKELWDKDLIYRGTKVVPFSTGLQTGLSNFEAGLDYRRVQDPAVTVLFELEDEKTYLAAWTTTPWTLPSNLALCVNEEMEYVTLKDETSKKSIIMARTAIPRYEKKHSLTEVSSCRGKDLAGKPYRPLFDFFAHHRKDKAFVVLCDDYVSTEAGTGIVHTAPAFGEDDDRVAKAHGLEVRVCPVDETGRFTEEVGSLQNLYVKEADKTIIKELKESGHLYEHSTCEHNYPFCYRSGTPLIYRAIPSWFVRVEKIRRELLASNAKVRWVPSHIKDGRFGQWLENARDWAISRNRVWGTPIPIWINDETGKIDCFGKITDLEKICGVKLNDLHRESVDSLTYTKPEEPGTYRRIGEVLDCWFESGSMPYAQAHYPFKDKEDFDRSFPAEFIAEGLDQTRGWFYTLMVLSTAIFKKPAFQNVIVNGLVMAHDGKKMSKSLRNYTPPDALMERHGADALRLYLINSPLVKGETQCFSDKGLMEMTRQVLLPWYNAFKFLNTYATVDAWNPEDHFEGPKTDMDRWILSKLQTLTASVSSEMEAYRLYRVVPPLFAFINDLTNWYIRLGRKRFWAEGLGREKREAYSTLFTTVKDLTTLMAPFAPFLAETIYGGLKKMDRKLPESVHLCSYPKALPSLMDSSLEEAMERIQQIVLLGRQRRNQMKIKVKTPLPSLTVIHAEARVLNEIKALENLIKTELNVKEVRYDQNEEIYIDLTAKPNSPVLGPKLGKDFGHYQKLISKLDSKECQSIESGQPITIDGRTFLSEEILIFREAKGGCAVLSTGLISIDLNCHLTHELLEEGAAREVINRIQKTRKDMRLHVTDRIEIDYYASPFLARAIKNHHNLIARETLAHRLIPKKSLEIDSPHVFSIDENELKIYIHTDHSPREK
ncbi:MAG: isoleucine--tRNA ligase [Bacteriovoracales bacterium]|nr:isoleucine--tRNA ligase [Bacteriovoracales bacterium]